MDVLLGSIMRRYCFSWSVVCILCTKGKPSTENKYGTFDC